MQVADAADPSDAKFTVRYDPADGVLYMRLQGFWTPGTLAAYTARLVFETASLRLRRKRFDILSDSRDFAVQSANVAEGFDALMKRGAAYHSGRTAIVVGSRLNKLQAERSLGDERVRVFLDMDEARHWLKPEECNAA